MTQPQSEKFTLHLMSFGHKHGLPQEADLMLDARILPNPYWVPELRPFPGTEPKVAAYVLDNEAGREFLDLLRPFLDFFIHRSRDNGKAMLRIAVGCTGGRHRSVAVLEALKTGLAPCYTVVSSHRDLDKEAASQETGD